MIRSAGGLIHKIDNAVVVILQSPSPDFYHRGIRPFFAGHRVGGVALDCQGGLFQWKKLGGSLFLILITPIYDFKYNIKLEKMNSQ